MEAGAKAKYLNSPETALFHKGALLFNHHRARKSAHDAGAIIVVEGYIDAIAVSEAGFPNVVAPLGTALTPDQCAAPVGDGERADPVLRRRRRRTARGVPGDRDGAAADRRGQEPALRASARRPGPGRSDPAKRAGGDGRASRATRGRSPTCCSCARPTASVSTRPNSARRSSAVLSRRSAKIADEPLRRHYQADMKRRLSAFFGDERERSARGEADGRRGFVAAARRAVPSARAPHRARGSAVGPAEQARPQGASAGARNHDPFDRAWPSGADREPLRGAGGGGIHGRGPRARCATRSSPPRRRRSISAAALGQWLNGAGRGAERERILALAAKMPNWWCMRPEAALGDADLVLEAKLGLASAGGRVT